MLGEAQHPRTRMRASARIATLLVGCTCTCFTASFVLAGQARAVGLESVTRAASPVTQAAAEGAAPVTQAAAQVTQAPAAPSGPTSPPSSTSPPVTTPTSASSPTSATAPAAIAEAPV